MKIEPGWRGHVQRLRSVQLLRAVAACAVVVLHAYPDPHSRLGNAGYGAFGVDLFFVISGFIIAQVAEGRSPGQFLRDRIFRIYPIWWIAVLPWLFMVPRGAQFVISSLTLWPIYSGGYYVPVLKVGWTLSFELLFYAGMTLALTTRALVPISLYGLLLVASLATTSPLFHFIGSPMALEFLMGVVLTRLPRRAQLGWLVPAGIALVALTSPATGDPDATLTGHFALQRAVEWGVPAAMIVWGVLTMEQWFTGPSFNFPVFLGDASYSIYLFHPLFAYGLTAPWPIRVGGAVALGCAMHWLVERRILALKAGATLARSHVIALPESG